MNRKHLPKTVVTDQWGQRQVLHPFENQLDLCCMARLLKENREVGAYLLNQGNSWQLVFGFRLRGLHTHLTREELMSISTQLEEAMKDCPTGESLRFYLSCFADDADHQQKLDSLVNQTASSLARVLGRSEQARVQQLTQSGMRRQWESLVFCTYTIDESGQPQWGDVISKLTRSLLAGMQNFSDWLRGAERESHKRFLVQVFAQAWESFQTWELLLNTKAGLEVSPLSAEELWQWIWQRFNRVAAPTMSQCLTWQDSLEGMELVEATMTQRHSTTVLIQGRDGQSACPEHRQNRSCVWVNRRVGGLLVMQEPPEGWLNTRAQLSALWKVLSHSQVRDTEVLVEINPASRVLIQDNLARTARQSRTSSTRSLQKGQGRDIGAEVKAEESFEAQRKLYKGSVALHCSVVLTVWRNTTDEVDSACDLLANTFGSASVVRVRHTAWDVWLQSLPITLRRLMQFNSPLDLEDRRLTLDNETVMGVMPLMLPRSLDDQGVEFVTMAGGRPIHLDLFERQTVHALLTGQTGSGKSVLLAQFIYRALLCNIPVTGMDMPTAAGESTFKTLVEALGAELGAYVDIRSKHDNLLQPPDLRAFDEDQFESRLKSWKSFVRKALNTLVMGKLQIPHLAQRVDDILLQALEVFLEDADMIERYNLAFQFGWRSPQWQQMPTLYDFIRYVSKERLQLTSYEAIDAQAINQIRSRLQAVLASPLGDAIGRPSNISPEPLMKFFALTGLDNDFDSLVLSIVAYGACIRTALSCPKSLFVGDELSTLFKKDGFANVVGELCATARKDGISILLSSQDPDTIATCSAGSMIMQNLTYRLTGRLTANACASFHRYLGYPMEVIVENASEKFLPRRSNLSSCWLIERSGQFWSAFYSPAEMLLATVASGEGERAARARVLAQYPNTELGRIQGLAAFTPLYVAALKEGNGFDQLGTEPSHSQSLRLVGSDQPPDFHHSLTQVH